MISKNCAWTILCLCCSLLTVGAPTATQAAEPPAEDAAAPNAKQGALMCGDLDMPGSHIKKHVCGTPEQWSAARARLDYSRLNLAASIGAVGANSYATPGMSGFGTAANQASFQR